MRTELQNRLMANVLISERGHTILFKRPWSQRVHVHPYLLLLLTLILIAGFVRILSH